MLTVLQIVIKWFFVFILVLFAFIVGYYQIKAEKNLTNAKEKYDVFLDQERHSYQPFVLFYVLSKRNMEEYKKYWCNIDFPYEQLNVTGYTFNSEFGAYHMYCHYDKSELPECEIPIPWTRRE